MTEAANVRGVIASILGWIAKVGGAVVGFGALTFSAGFLAQRAQYDFARVPFVFVDYWAYAEAGLFGGLTSFYAILERPLVLILIVLTTAAVVLLLEHRPLWDGVLKPHWVLLLAGAVILLAGGILRQQLAVHSLRRALPDDSVRLSVLEPDGTPAVFPFSWFLAAARPAPIKAAELPRDSFAAWQLIADELDAQLTESKPYLSLRPRPSWALVNAAGGGENFLGMAVPNRCLEEERARRLYGSLINATLLTAWLFAAVLFAEGAVLQRLQAGAYVEGRTRASRLAYRLKEEIWFLTRWVATPAAVCLISAVVLLIPESYGLLASPRLGQEFVEVILGKDEGAKPAAAPVAAPARPGDAESASSDDERSTGTAARNAESVADLRRQGLRLVVETWGAEPSQRERLLGAWRALLESLEKVGTPASTEGLRGLAAYSSIAAPALSADAWGAWNRSAARTMTSVSGFILYYPRSETDYLRLLSRTPAAGGSGWTIRPLKISAIAEIRVREDEDSRLVVRLLRELPKMDPRERGDAVNEIMLTGHPRALDVLMGAALDPHSTVHGPAITAVGGLGAALPQDAAHAFQRAQVVRLLLHILNDAKVRPDNRGAAGTALHFVLNSGDGQTCATLQNALTHKAAIAADEQWEIRGVVITGLAKLGCRAAEPQLLRILADESVPSRVRATIPTALTLIGSDAAVGPLAQLVTSPEVPADMQGTAITALGIMRQTDTRQAVDALTGFLATPSTSTQRRDIDQRQVAFTSLTMLGDRSALPTLHELAKRQVEPNEELRGSAIVTLGQLQSPESENLLLEIAEDAGETPNVRMRALLALAQLADEAGVYRLYELFTKVPLEMKALVVEVLKRRADSGVGSASWLAEERETQLKQAVERAALERSEKFRAVQELMRQMQDGEEEPSSAAAASPEPRQP